MKYELFSIELSKRSLGVGFDCASKSEIQCAINAGATPEQIVYANQGLAKRTRRADLQRHSVASTGKKFPLK